MLFECGRTRGGCGEHVKTCWNYAGYNWSLWLSMRSSYGRTWESASLCGIRFPMRPWRSYSSFKLRLQRNLVSIEIYDNRVVKGLIPIGFVRNRKVSEPQKTGEITFPPQQATVTSMRIHFQSLFRNNKLDNSEHNSCYPGPSKSEGNRCFRSLTYINWFDPKHLDLWY